MMRPLGTPPMPSAASSAREPVGMASTCISGLSPRRITVPLPKFFSIWAMAVSSAFFFSLAGYGVSMHDFFIFISLSLALLCHDGAGDTALVLLQRQNYGFHRHQHPAHGVHLPLAEFQVKFAAGHDGGGKIPGDGSIK